MTLGPTQRSEPPKITELDQRTIERIAAGEVVERPASVVKELLENAIDAGAETVEVSVAGDGTESITVADDGHGMTKAGVQEAVREHTTSKIDGVDDLETGLETLGFRGEALHTIGAVARVTIETKPANQDIGTKLRYEGGEVVSVEPMGRSVGTTVTVADLFYNTPAREKYLKTEATEFGHISQVVAEYALANPGVAISLTHDDRETFSTSGDGNLRSAVLSIYGREVAEAMIPVGAGNVDERIPDGPWTGTDSIPGVGVDDASEDSGSTQPINGVAGVVSHPETTRASNDYISIFVNGRAVHNDTIRDAILGAYDEQLSNERYPFAVVFLDIPPQTVDANVHPRKREILLDDDHAVHQVVKTTVRNGLLSEGIIRASAPRGQSAPSETTPQTSFEDRGDRSESLATEDTSTGRTEAHREAQSSRDDSNEVDTEPETDRANQAKGHTEPAASGAESAPESPAGETEHSHDNDTERSAESGTIPDTVETPDASSEAERSQGGIDDRPAQTRLHEGGSDEGADTAAEGGAARDTSPPSIAGERLPSLELLAQLDETYLLCRGPDGLVLIDQHAADERIRYERLRAQYEDGGVQTQQLAAPVTVPITGIEASQFSMAAETLSELGFDVERATDGELELEVRGVPAVADQTVDPETVRDVLQQVITGTGDTPDTTDLIDSFLADLACYPSLTANTSITEGSMVGVLEALGECSNPYACPHGRPVVIEINYDEIEERFERDYPGHP